MSSVSKPGSATVTVEEAAVLLGVSRGTAYDAVRVGDIPSVKVGRRILVPKVKLAELLGGPADPAGS
jgi:excisionase family DNA binding protein